MGCIWWSENAAVPVDFKRWKSEKRRNMQIINNNNQNLFISVLIEIIKKQDLKCF